MPDLTVTRKTAYEGGHTGPPLPVLQSCIMKKIAILGSTGSIGTSTLAVAEKFPDHLRLVKTGTTYAGYYSSDNMSWVRIRSAAA